jgi:hypothetical protein
MRMIKPGMTVDVVVPELGEACFPAKVMRNAGAFDRPRARWWSKCTFQIATGRLLPGMYAQAKAESRQCRAQICRVPINALMIGGEGTRVAVVDTGGVIHIKPVKLGRDFGKEVEILAGLAEQRPRHQQSARQPARRLEGARNGNAGSWGKKSTATRDRSCNEKSKS